MTDIYLVVDVYADDRRLIIGACETLPLAEELASKCIDRQNILDNEITYTRWWELRQEYYINHIPGTSFVEDMIERHPEYSVSNIEIADRVYSAKEYIDTIIEKITLYTNKDDINGINS